MCEDRLHDSHHLFVTVAEQLGVENRLPGVNSPPHLRQSQAESTMQADQSSRGRNTTNEYDDTHIIHVAHSYRHPTL